MAIVICSSKNQLLATDFMYAIPKLRAKEPFLNTSLFLLIKQKKIIQKTNIKLPVRKKLSLEERVLGQKGF